jgi:hypothetical protein
MLTWPDTIRRIRQALINDRLKQPEKYPRLSFELIVAKGGELPISPLLPASLLHLVGSPTALTSSIFVFIIAQL